MGNTLKLLFVSIFLTAALAASANTAVDSGSVQTNLDVIAALGDSISAASLAETTATDAVNKYLDQHPNLSRTKRAQMLKKIYRASVNRENKETLSWVSGKDVQSHFIRMKNLFKAREPQTKIEILNLSVPGAKAVDMKAQAQQLVDAMKTKKYGSLRYLTYMIGGNDACSKVAKGGTPNAEMLSALEESFKVLSQIKQSQPIPVLFSSLPRIPDLGKPEIMNNHVFALTTCRFIQLSVLNLCDPMIDWKTQAQYNERVGYVEAKNQLLQKFSEDMAKKYPQFQIHYSDVFYQHPITIRELAMDCFHPNTKGHEIISQQLWDAQPWFH